MEMVNIKINGQSLSVPANYTILEAARSANIEIPTLCYLKDVSKTGSCRMCIVEVVGARNLQAACVYPVSEGMEVLTNTQKVRDARKVNLELLLSNHDRKCLTCARNQNCELQKLSDELGVTDITYMGERNEYDIDEVSPSIVRDNNKCVLCRRCVSACKTIQTVSVIDENIIYDFAAWYTANSFERFTLVTDETAPAGFGIADGMSDVLQWDATSLRVCGVSDTWGSDKPVEDRAVGSRFAMTIDVPAGKAGWYTPQLNYTGNTGEEGLCSIYHIYNGEATYLGDTVNGGDNYLAPVYLEAGENIIAGGVVRGTTGMFIKKLAFTKYEGEQATLSSITVADPADLTVGEQSARYEITGAMSDGSAMKFPPLGMDTETFHNSGLNTTDYIKVTATPANVVDVLAYSGSYEGMTNYYYEVKAVSEGDVVLSFVPVVDGVEKDDLKVTKNISVTHPDGNITGDSVSIWYSATDVADAIDAEAKGLLDGNIAAGEVNNVAVGTEVTVTAEDSEELTFLYWYNGNSKRVLSDDAEYTFTAGTNTSVYAKYIAKGEEATEYFNASGALIEEAEGTFAAEPDVELGGYKLFKDTAAAVAEIATATAESADFVCWTKDGKAVSYNTTYTYAKWGNVGEAVEVTEGEKSSAPAVVLFQNGNAYMLELVNFEGKTIIEKGIAFNGDIDSCTSKAVSADKNVKQFTATGDGEAVAYVIYRDGAAVRVAYSD